MSKKNRSEIIQDALDMLDDEMIEDVERLRENGVKNVSETVTNSVKKFPWRRWTALAASIALFLVGSWAWENYVGPFSQDSEQDKYNNMESDDNDGVTENIEGAPENEEVAGPENTTESIDVDPPEQPGEPEQSELPGQSELPDETLPILGDKYSLQDNYVSVSMLPHKAWASEVADSEPVPIGEEYKEEFDKLVEAMCSSHYSESQELPESDPDMIYHLFFERTDGEVVHCWLFEGGYICYDDMREVSIELDRAIYATIFKILAMHW